MDGEQRLTGRTRVIWSMHETIALAGAWVPGSLIDPAVLARIEACARRLPDAFSSYYLECRLGDGDPRVDLLASILAGAETAGAAGAAGPADTAGAAGAAGAAARPGVTGLAAALDRLDENAPGWARVGRFVHTWCDPASLLGRRIPLIWLELDDMHRAMGEAVPGPCFHACLDSGYLQQTGHRAPLAGGLEEPDAVLRAAFDVLLERPLPAAAARALHTCLAALAPGERMIHVSAMLARTPASIKLYGSAPAPALAAYLQRIGWPGRIEELDDLLRRFCAPSTVGGTVYFDLAIDEQLTPYVGIVFSQLQLDGSRDPRREALLALLVDAGLCTPEKRDALLQWPGSARVHHAGASAPARLRRWLDLKIGQRPGRALEAKAYLGFMPVFSLL